MASSPGELDKLIDRISRSDNIDDFKKILVPGYYHKVGRVDTKSAIEFIQYLNEFKKEFNLIESETVTIINREFNGKMLCMGTWKWVVTIGNSEQRFTWTGNWSDIRAKCSDGLWRVVGTVGTVNTVR